MCGYTDSPYVPDPPVLQVDLPDNPEVGRIHGPDGSLLSIVTARSAQPIGFRPERKAAVADSPAGDGGAKGRWGDTPS